MMRGLSKSALAWIVAVLAFGFSLHAQTQPTLTGFALGALPNPVGYELDTTITGVVFGSPDGAIPDGQIDFFVSGDPTDCNDYYSDIGTGTVSGGVAQVTFYGYPPPGLSFTLSICGNYTSSETGYAPATAGPFELTIYQPTSMIVYVPPASLPGAAVTFNVALTTPSGQTPPSGTISIQDPNNGYATVGGPVTVGNITVNGQTVLGATIPNVSLSSNQYYAVYSGDNNYAPQSAYGTIFLENPLTSISPASFIAGAAVAAPYTNCQLVTGAPGLQVTLTGIGFTGNTTARIQVSPTAGYQALQVSQSGSSPTTQLIGCIPTSNLATPATMSVVTQTGNLIGGPVTFQVYAPYSVNTTVTSTPATFQYGSNLTSIIDGTATRTAATDAAVPAGTATFSLTRVTGANGIPITVGTGQFSQVSTAGTYQSPLVSAIDFNDTQKSIAADLNGDGYADVVGMPGLYYGDTAAGPYLQVFLSTGANAFETEQQVFAGCAPQDFAVGDINGDSVPDLVVVCPGVTNSFLQAYYMLGNGDGSFQAPVAFGTGSQVSNATQVVIGWFNNDGFNDIAVVDGFDGYLQVISPFGTNTCNSPTYLCDSYVYFDTQYGPVFNAAAADFNQDGLSDIVLAEYSYPSDEASPGAVLSLINSNSFPGSSFDLVGLNQFTAYTYYMSSMSVTDVNGDGYPDVLIADPGAPENEADSGNVLYFQNDGTGNLPLNLTEPVPGVLSVAGAPFPTNGQPASNAAVAPGWNIVIAGDTGIDSSDNFVTEVELQNGNWTTGTTYDTGTMPYYTDGGGPLPGTLVAGDLNGDGYLDFAATGFLSDDAAPSGSVDELVPFYYGNDSQVSLNNASLLPTPGNYSLGMDFPGNQLFQSNSTATAAVVVTKGVVSSSSVTGPGTVNYGTSFNLVANIVGVANGAIPTGTVTFYSDGNQIGTPQTLTATETSATTTLNVTQNLTAGIHAITITYNGDPDYRVAANVANTTLQVNGEAFTLNVATSVSSSGVAAGSMVNIQVSGSGVTLPAGETVSLSGLPLANNPTLIFNSSGVASFNYGALSPGGYTVTASYGGDAVFAAQTASATFSVNPTPVTVTLSSSANPITYPATATLTADATTGGLGVPTGSINFADNGSQLQTVNLAPVNGNSGLLASATNNPYAVDSGYAVIASVTGDFNHDGNPDIATVQANADSSAVLVVALGNGDGTFQTPIVYGTTAGSTAADFTSNSIAVADLTGSGYADSLVLGASDGNIEVYLYNGNANGILALSQTLNSGFTSVVGVATAKLNTTGQVGFAAITTNAVEAWVDNGNGTFPTSPYWSTTSTYQYSNFTGIVFADLNNDGYVDVAISDNNGQNGPDLLVLIYDPAVSSYAAPVTYPVGTSATAIASGNINNDVYPDLAVVSNTDSTVDVLLNNQAGGFPAGTIFGVANNPTGVAIADFNGDGFADIAVSGNGTGAGAGTTVLLSSSTGAMTGEVLLPTTGAGAVAAADFNKDGNTDLAVGSTGVTIFLDSGAQAMDLNQTFTAGTQPLTGVYVPLEGSNLAGSTSSILDLTVNQDVPVITWANPGAISYGTALSATQLDATPPAGIPGTLNYTPAAGTVLTAGTHQLAVTFVPTDAVDYESVTQFANITVNPVASTVSWNNPASITYGTALSATQLDATGSVPGTFTYNPPLGTILTAGTHSLTANFVPTDSVDYKSATDAVSIAVSQATPTVTWGAPASIAYGTALTATQLDATASVPGTFTYNPALGTVLSAGSHQLSVTFAPTDGTDYATQTANTTIQISQGASTITWAAPSAITYGTALSASQLDATASVPGSFTYNPAIGTVLTAGSQTLGVTFTPTDTTDYTGTTKTVTIQVNQATPAITWTAPAAITYGTALSATQLDATSPTAGTFTYTPAAGTQLTAGSHSLSVSFSPTDATDYTTATGTATIQVNQATPVITWASPGNMNYGTPLGATQLDATATPAGGTFTYNPPAGTTLPVGTDTLSVTYVPTDTTDYATATATTTVNVVSSLALSSIAPTSAPYNSAATSITLIGTGFTESSIVQLNGTAISSVYVGPTQMTAQIPASFFQQVTTGTITVFDPVHNVTSSSQTFTVTLPNLQYTFSGPGTSGTAEQPTLNLTLSQAYPADIQGTMTLSVSPVTTGGPTDPSVQFATGGTTFNFTIPAGSTTVPSVQIQTGTLAAFITVNLTLQVNEQQIATSSVDISVPSTAPVITSVSLDRSGDTLTVTVVGYSSSRDMSTAAFDFTPASGSSISNPEISLDVSTEFGTWYSSAASIDFGSEFTYQQIFNLNNNASTIGGVSVTLTNSVGTSNVVTAQ